MDLLIVNKKIQLLIKKSLLLHFKLIKDLIYYKLQECLIMQLHFMIQ